MSDARPVGPPSVAELFLRFTQVGASGFGGVMPFARRMLVEERRWLNAEEFSEALSVCQILPGLDIGIRQTIRAEKPLQMTLMRLPQPHCALGPTALSFPANTPKCAWRT